MLKKRNIVFMSQLKRLSCLTKTVVFREPMERLTRWGLSNHRASNVIIVCAHPHPFSLAAGADRGGDLCCVLVSLPNNIVGAIFTSGTSPLFFARVNMSSGHCASVGVNVSRAIVSQWEFAQPRSLYLSHHGDILSFRDSPRHDSLTPYGLWDFPVIFSLFLQLRDLDPGSYRPCLHHGGDLDDRHMTLTIIMRSRHLWLHVDGVVSETRSNMVPM